MFQKIIVGFDGSERGRDALALGRALREATDGQLILAASFRYEPLPR